MIGDGIASASGFAGSFGRSLEQRSHIYVETAVGITRCHYFGTAVVTVLTHFSYHDTGLTSLFLRKFLSQLTSSVEVAVVLTF